MKSERFELQTLKHCSIKELIDVYILDYQRALT